jgi:ABC-type sugar transport system permease subunit
MTGLLQRQLRDFAVAAALAVIIASVAFVAARNHDVIDRQLDLARRSVAALVADSDVLPTVHGALIGPAVGSPKHPELRHREIKDAAGWRLLAGGQAPDKSGERPTRSTAEGGAKVEDKLFYDAAARFDREHAAFVELLRDGSGRAIAANAHGSEIAVAITAPASPAPYPLLVMIGVLGLGGALCAAGALVGGRAARAGAFAGIAVLGIPALLWQSWVAALVIAMVAAGTAWLQHTGMTDRFARGLVRNRVAVSFLAPAGLSMLVLVAAPFVLGILLGFYDHHQGTWTFVGIHNFVEILSGNGRALDDPLNFWFILGVTVLWTICNVLLHVTIGVALALLLSRKWLRGKGVFRMLLILPWAIPNYITALMWHGMFDGQYGAVNSILHGLGMDGVSWFTSWTAAFSANVITNTWLGFPFMMVVALGALETIPKELYEAAAVDGASPWQRFRHITLPHLRPALGPAVALGSIWTFNMFNVIFLVSGGKPGDSTNILVTDAYRWAFERGDRYGMAAAYGTIIFLILLLWNVFGARIVRSKGDDT